MFITVGQSSISSLPSLMGLDAFHIHSPLSWRNIICLFGNENRAKGKQHRVAEKGKRTEIVISPDQLVQVFDSVGPIWIPSTSFVIMTRVIWLLGPALYKSPPNADSVAPS